MEAQLRGRLAELRRDLEVGKHRLAQLDTERAHLRDTVLRISGAIQVLEELMAPLGVGDSEQQVGQQGRISPLPKQATPSGQNVMEDLPHAAGTGVVDIFVGPS
jgi:hypothetical protein